ncbi:Conserved_hypothetical protein [Hexamita inflata]|uniref:Uncharacterized protein n=1 Tax=Hexamita inflata TaxID=28002 RepID=A0AA86NCX0_9EUKA|nr:Conserved hypothetical protein [Hexamita inflata]
MSEKKQHPCFVVRQQSDLHGDEIQKHMNVSILNIYFKKLDFIPVHIQILKISNCSLQGLKNLRNILGLKHLDISYNLVSDLSEILLHQELTYLDISNNNVIVIDPVAALANLRQLYLQNNKIVNMEPLIHHQYFDPVWIQPQYQPLMPDFAKSLVPGSANEKVLNLMQSENCKKLFSDYLVKMIKELAPCVNNCHLTVENNQSLTDFAFIDCFHVETAVFNNCQNIKFENVPKKIKTLSIINSNLVKINGLEKMTQLESINLSGNNLIKCELLCQMNLKAVNLQGNKIIDLKNIKKFIQFQNVLVLKQEKPTLPDIKKYLGQECSEAQIQEINAEIVKNAVENEQIIYDTEMIKTYKDKVNNGVLIIKEDLNITSIEFAELIGHTNQNKVTDLKIISCQNLKLDRCPKSSNSSITKFTVNSCDLTDLSGIQVMKQLTELNMSFNQITDINQLAPLVNITSLDLGKNNIEDISVIQNFKKLKQLDLSENLFDNISSLKNLLQMQVLDLSYNNLKSVSDLQALTNIIQLNISMNQITNIDALANMIKLTYLNLSVNKIVSIQICSKFYYLSDLRLELNFIQDFEPIAKLQFSNQKWIQKQNTPSKTDFMNSFNCNEYELTKMIEKNKQKKEMSDNKYGLIKKYENQVVNGSLKVNGEKKLNNLQFTDVMKLTELEAINCQTIDFGEDQVPLLLNKMKLNNCVFQNTYEGFNLVTGIYQMEQLVELDLANNKLKDISEIGNLNKLKKLFLQNNEISRIYELGNLKQLTNLNVSNNIIIFSEPICSMKLELIIENNFITDNANLKNQQKPQSNHFKAFLGPNCSNNQVNELCEFTNYQLLMSQKCKNQVNNQQLTIQNDATLIDFGFISDLNVNSLSILNCQNAKMSSKFKHFETINGQFANYPEVKVKVPLHIVSLTVNNCSIISLDGIQLMNQLTHVDLRNNAIILVEPLKYLTNLKKVFIDNNFVQDLEYLVNQDWVCEQRVPTDANLQAYLTDINSSLTLHAFKAQITSKKAKSELLLKIINQQYAKYDSDQSNKFKLQVNYNKLEIISDTGVKEIKFVDIISVKCLNLNKCTNFSFQRAPTQLLYLTLNDCNITDLEGLQQFKQLKKFELIKNTLITSIKQVYSLTNLLSLTINNTYINNLVGIKQLSKLQYIDLCDNCIVSIEPVKSLQYLKQVLIDNNFIQDLEHLTTTKNYNPEWIYFQNAITDSELARYLNDTQLKCTLLELKTSFEGKKRRTDELIRDHPATYDAKMMAKYKNKVDLKGQIFSNNGPYLQISNDPEIRDLRFVSELGVTDLYLDSCQNAHLLRAPANLRRLIHFPSGMKTAKGVERLVELEVLCIVQTQIVELNIRGLQKLKTLDCRNNNIMDMSAAEYLKAKGCCKERYLIDDQQQPSQQEIDEARLW